MNNKLKIFKTLFLKELRDVLRDKKAIMMMVLVPVVVYPLIVLGSLMVTNILADDKDTTYDITVYNESTGLDARNLENILKENAVETNEEDGSKEQLYNVVFNVSDTKISEDQCKDMIGDKNLDVYLEIADNGERMMEQSI